MMPDWKYIIIHHSWSKDHDTLDWQGIIDYHTSFKIDCHIVTRTEYYRRLDAGDGKKFQKPWSDVGYHFGVEKIKGSYQVLIGRPLTRQGAHCRKGGMNNKAIGVCIVGNYDDKAPKNAMLYVVVKRLIVPLMNIFPIAIESIQPHSKYNKAKTCPGKKFSMDTLRDFVKESI